MIKGIVGITGYAKSGKDTLFGLIRDRIPAERVSLADSLKADIRQFILDKFYIDVLNCSPEQKELIRPFMVEYGQIHRKNSKGRYFTDKITADVIRISKKTLCVITDIRYADPLYPDDEFNWLKGLNGKLIHLSKFFKTPTGDVPLDAPNIQELTNDAILFPLSDIRIKWPHSSGDLSVESEEIFDHLITYLEKNL